MRVNGRCRVCHRPIPAERPTPTLCGRPTCDREQARRDSEAAAERDDRGDDQERRPLLAALAAPWPGRNRVWI